MGSFSVDVQVFSDGGTYHETVAQGDDTPGNVTPSYGLADPLIIRQALSVSDRLPLSHPLPEEATITLIAPTAATYSRMALGDPVAVKLYPSAGFAGTPVTFYGRIGTELTGVPDPMGVRYTLGCIDYTADLAELPVGLTSWPAQTAQFRLSKIMAQAGVGYAMVGFPLNFDMNLPSRSAGVSDALTELLALLDGWVGMGREDEANVDYHTVTGSWDMQKRPRLVPNITSDLLDPATPFLITSIGPISKRVRYVPPARLVNTAGIRRVQVSAADSSPTTGAPIIDGARVQFAPAFTQAKGGDGVANVTTATDSDGTVYTFDWRTALLAHIPATLQAWQLGLSVPIALGGPAIVQKLDIQGDSTNALTDVVENWRVPFRPNLSGAWKVGTMSWQAWAEPSPWRRPVLTELLTVSNVATGKLPTDREWVTGLVAATTVTVQRGRTTVDIDLVPNTYDRDLQRLLQGASNGVVSMDSPIVSGVTLAQTYARDTLDDYAIVRGS